MRPTNMRTTAFLPAPLMLAAAVFTAAGGYIHAREWVRVYREVPSVIPGSAVVRIGFPINAITSLVLAAALVVAALWVRNLAVATLAVTAMFEVGSLAALIATRTDSLFGWMEPGWSASANQTRATEVGALVAIGAAAVVLGWARRADHATAPAAPVT